jgi:anti-anti-sigma factor
MTGITCHLERDFPVTVIRLEGMLDHSRVATVRSVLLKCLDDHPVAVVVDLSNLTVTDDATLALFPALARRAARWKKVQLVLCAPAPGTAAALERLGISRRVPVYAGRQEALSSTARPPANRRFRKRFLPIPQAGAQSRVLVRERCAAWGVEDVSEDAQIVVTELVSNAVEHAGTALDVVASLRGDYLHLAVHDGDPTPPRRKRRPRGARGRGLQLVESVAASWGSLLEDGGKVVWATLRVRPAQLNVRHGARPVGGTPSC